MFQKNPVLCGFPTRQIILASKATAVDITGRVAFPSMHTTLARNSVLAILAGHATPCCMRKRTDGRSGLSLHVVRSLLGVHFSVSKVLFVPQFFVRLPFDRKVCLLVVS